MKSGWSILIDIEGSDVALSSDSLTLGNWATSTLPVIRTVGQGLTSSLDLETFQTDLGGTTVFLTDINSLLNDQNGTSTKTTLTANLTKTGGTITAASTAGFTASGVIWIGGEAINYSAIIGNDFLTSAPTDRGFYSTTAQAHPLNSNIYSYNPSILGRRVDVYWKKAGVSHLMYKGIIEGYDFTDSGATLSITSLQYIIQDKVIAGVDFGQATLARPAKKVSPLGTTKGSKPYLDPIILALTDKANPLTTYGTALTKNGPVHIKIDDEIISYEDARYPLYEIEIGTVVGTGSFTTTITNSLDSYHLSYAQKGDRVDVVSFATGEIINEGCTIKSIEAVGGVFTAGAVVNITLTNITNIVVPGDLLKGNYNTKINPWSIKRGVFKTPIDEHEAGANVTEIRVLEGDSIDLLYRVLFSDQGDKTNGPELGFYDDLPPGWGLALKSAQVDFESFKNADLVSFPRRFLLTDSLDAQEFLAWSALLMGAVFSWDNDGVLRARPSGDLYPSEVADHTIDISKLFSDSIPALRLDTGTILNKINIKADIDENGDHETSVTVVDAESVSLYGARKNADAPNLGLMWAASPTAAYTALFNLISMRTRPTSILQVEVIFYELPDAATTDHIYRLGQLVSVVIPHLPNIKGGSGINETFKIIEVSPNETNGTIGLMLQSHPTTPDLGRVNVSGIVQSFDPILQRVTLEPNTVSKLSKPLSAAPLSFTPPGYPGPGLGGTEDIEWFLDGDAVTHWENVYPGTGYNYIITNINYSNRTFDLSGALSSLILPGDVFSFSDWPVVSSSLTAAFRRFFFIWSTVGSTLGGGDNPYRWGT